MGTQTLQVSFSTDGAGFVSQECPACEQRFKIQPGKGSPRPLSHCPFCEHAGENCWFTPEQAEYLKAIAVREVVGPHLEELDRAFQGLGSIPGVTVTGHLDLDEERVPVRPEESDDETWSVTTFECCGETVQHDPAQQPAYCIICGRGTSTPRT